MLLSINPEHVENILNGTKKVEYRKIKCARNDINGILIYSTAPVKQVVAEVELKNILVDKPEMIWNITKEISGITREFFDKYYKEKQVAVAYELGNIKKFDKPKLLSDFGLSFAPQSFVYLD